VIRLVEPLRTVYEAYGTLPPVPRPEAKGVTVPADCGLDTVCPDCHGDKSVQDPGWAEWYTTEHEAREKAAPGSWRADEGPYREFLDAHPYPWGPEEIPCETCNGLGTVPTEIGEALLAFLRPRFAETAWRVS
jgi:hypothetical protein